MIASCAAAAEELSASREAIDALDRQNEMLKQRLDYEKRISAILAELNASREREADALRATLAAKDEALAAKDAALKAKDEVIAKLKTRGSSPWKRIGDILIGVGAAVLIR